MSRRFRSAALALAAVLALGASACASATEPALADCDDGGRTSTCQFDDTGHSGSGI